MHAAPTRREQILAAAGHVLTADGIAALTMGRLAHELGIKAPSLYKHFTDKDEILALLVADGLAQQADALEAAGDGLPALARAYRRFALDNRELYRLMTERLLLRERLPDGLEARAAKPLTRALGVDLARAAWAFAHGMVVLELGGRFPPGADLDAAWAAAISAFERQARSRKASASASSADSKLN